MTNIVVYSKEGCPYCSLLKAELRKRGLAYQEFDLTDDATRKEFYANTDTNSVPQLFLADGVCGLTAPTGTRIGGWTEVSQNWTVFES